MTILNDLSISSGNGIGIIILVVICLFLLLGLIILISFHKTRKATIITIFMVFSLLIIGALTILFVWPVSPSTSSNSQFSLNFYNKDPALQNVSVSIPQISGSPTNLSLDSGESQTGIMAIATSTITAKGYRIDENGNKINYTLDYTFNNITNNNVYYTTGGVQTDNTYLDLTVDNQSSSPITLYTSDISNNIYPCFVVPIGPSIIPSYVGEFFSLNSQGTEGIIIPSTSVLLLFIDANLKLSLKNLPSSNVIIENGTSIKGILQSLDSWKVGAAWSNRAIITSGQGVKSIIFIDQWWRIVDDKKNPVTDVYIISTSDIGTKDPIVLV